MKLKEFEQDPAKMDKEELEMHMLSILKEMRADLDSINEEYRKDNGKSDRSGNSANLPRHSPAV